VSRWKDKYVIGLTGNIAVGKSLVRQMLQSMGAYTIDADGLSHQAMMPGAPAYLPVVEMFGKFVLDSNGYVNRQTLGNIVFTFPDALTKLEAIVHPIVNQAIMTLAGRAKQRVIVIEAIKLLESQNLSQVVDAIWVVDASPETQMKRLVEKRKMSEEDARRRIMAQRSQADKLKRAAVIILNDGNPEETWKQVQVGWNDVRRVTGITGTETEGMAAVKVQPQPAAPTPTPQPSVKPITPVKPASQPLSQPATPSQTVAPAPSVTPGVTKVPQTKPLPTMPETAPDAVVSNDTAAATVAAAAEAARKDDTLPKPAHMTINVRRGKPGETEQIAAFINRVSDKAVTRMDIMLAFGQKSYLVAEDDKDQIIGIVGWQVENLITRVDEVYLDPAVPKEVVIVLMISAMEEHSRDLQSEVSFIFLPAATAPEIFQAFSKGGYQPFKIEDIKFPAWREVAHEAVSADGQALMKQLRADRVMKPI
jgi:dephospho-CoA kinase